MLEKYAIHIRYDRIQRPSGLVGNNRSSRSIRLQRRNAEILFARENKGPAL
ncbi:hypothetical protein D3C76_1609620 [compost metagenome]